MGTVDALYIYDELNNVILEHVYTGRPPSSDTLLTQYLSKNATKPAFTYLKNTNPPTLLASVIHDRLLLLCPTSAEIEPLLVLEFLHRVTDALQDYLGSPLLASKIEGAYDVVAQIVGEICDAGLVCNTEPNALRDVVEAPNWVGSFLGGLGLPASSHASTDTPSSLSSASSASQNALSSIPWRRSNVRHTSNELYVDIVEKLSVIYAPSGRPLLATAQGTIAFTSQISGVPDLLLKLSCPGGKVNITNAMDIPTFHPCVRLNRWRESPGELSFVPPDGKFVLAGYECDLMPNTFTEPSINSPNVDLPAYIELRTSLGTNGDEFDVVLTRKAVSSGIDQKLSLTNKSNGGLGRFAAANASAFNTTNAATSTGPPLEQVVVTIPLPKQVRNVLDIKAGRGEAHYLPAEGVVEWRISTKEAATIPSAGTLLRGTIVGAPVNSHEDDDEIPRLKTDTYDYDEDETTSSYQDGTLEKPRPLTGQRQISSESKQASANKSLMPRSAYLSFNVRGWLASGIRVESLTINTTTSKGLGAGVQPYKGVKYHTISREGIEIRC